ncbi:HD domain-containing protein [[Eubacterium] hominis]|uniref:HD domain-containing protein n=1 Tax=[Eubacterium] hominis TaxID=2764325 RepID=UPI003A4D32D4
MKQTDEVKVMRDPIHGYIHVNLQVVWDCINAKEFQRLRRIHQLGGDFQVYHTAEHSRFSHSLGVYEIVRRMVNEISELKENLTEYEKATVMLAGLLHDIGHGPFSHAFEGISPLKHEEYTVKIIMEDTEIHHILAAVDECLPRDVASIITYQHPKECMNQMVSGQLDADRMDYLLRDAYFTGTSYGNFDLERILRTIRVHDGRIVVKESGIHSVEDYIMARYHMYWQVYLHPVARSYESLLSILFRRLKDLYQMDSSIKEIAPMFAPFLSGECADVKALYRLDEPAALYGFSCLIQGKDFIAADLAYRILNRKLFEYQTIQSDEDVKDIITYVKKLGYDSTYYVHQDAVSQKPYSPYASNENGHNIWVLEKNGEVVELSLASDIVKALIHADLKEEKKVYYPLERLSFREDVI